jgi:hypothetical protein
MALIEVPAGSVYVRRERTSMIGIGKSLGHLKKLSETYQFMAHIIRQKKKL